ncbi:MAG: amidohydrolase family protein [Anaerolineales bacterium]|nr:amidohydrolase family protein [Anaerolineales bacterium]
MTRLRLPGLIDPHVHVRDLNQSHKEDWDSATAAALAGGITTILAMPNTQPPITDGAALAQYQAAAQARARCDYGLYFGAGPGNVESAARFAPQVAGMKMYLDSTFGDLKMDALSLLVEHCARWPKESPLLAHAEGHHVASAILAAHLAGRSIHICHVSRKDEIELIARARDKGYAVTCEVCPHHMFMTLDDCGLAPGYLEVRPRLATPADVAALWAHLADIDCFATDHAPHTRAEKESEKPPPGFPGLETALALWLTAAHQGRLTLEDLLARMHTNPRRIFNLPEQPDTWIEVDADCEWQPDASRMYSRAGWTPFVGWRLRGRVIAVTLRGQLAYDGERVLAQPGTGRDVMNSSYSV